MLNVSSKNSPKASLPTVPQKYASAPNFDIAAATLAGAPPAFFKNPLVSFKDFPKSGMFVTDEFSIWYKKYQDRIKSQGKSKEEVFNLMKNSNPAVIPRNHRVEEALAAAENGDFSVMNNLLKALANPFEHSDFQKEYSKPAPKSQCDYKTYCGT